MMGLKWSGAGVGLVVFLVVRLVGPVWAGYQAGPYEFEGQTLRVAWDESGHELTRRYRPGEKLYILLTSDQLANTDRQNRVRLLSLAGKPMVGGSFTQLSEGEYGASLTVPIEAAGPLNLEVDLKSKAAKHGSKRGAGVVLDERGRRSIYGQFQAKVTLVREGDEWPVTLHIADQKHESYVTSSGSVVLARLRGDGPAVERVRVSLNTFNQRGRWLDQVAMGRDGDWYEAVVPMPSELVDGGWYWLKFDLGLAGGERRQYGVFLVVDDSEPEVVWQSPGQGQRVEADLELKGTATADRLWKRQEYYRAGGGSDWVAVGDEGMDSVIGGVLDIWPLAELANGTYELKLTAWSLAGRAKETIVRQIRVVKPLGRIKLSVVKQVELPAVAVSTADEINAGVMGGEQPGVRVADRRSSELPWTVTMTMSRLVEKRDSKLVIPVTMVTIDPGEIEPLNNNQVVNIFPGERHNLTSETEALTLMTAEVGHSLGEFGQNPAILLTIPANTPAGEYRGRAVVTIQ